MIGRVGLLRSTARTHCCDRLVFRRFASRSGSHGNKTTELNKDIRKLEYEIETNRKKKTAPTSSLEDAEVNAISKELSEVSQPRKKISPDYLENLRIKFLDTRPLPSNMLSDGVSTGVDEEVLATSNDSISDSQGPKSLQVSTGDFEKLIYANALAKRPEMAEQALALMERYQCTPTARCYNHLMDAYANARQVESVIDVFKRLRKTNLEPDIYSYSILIKALALNSRIDDALITFERIKKMGIIPTQPVFSSLIRGCLKARRIDQAWDIFDSMRLSYHQPDEVSYTMMIHACAQRSEVERALNLFEDMIGHRLYPTDVTFNVLINACAKRPDYFDEAFNLFDQMQNTHGFHPDIVTYNTLLSACARKKDLNRARTIFKTLIDHSIPRGEVSDGDDNNQAPPIAMDGQTYTNIFWCYASYKPPLEEPSTDDVEKDQPLVESGALQTYTVLRDSIPESSAQVVREAKSIYAYLIQQNVKMTPDLLNQYLAIHVYQRQPDECLDIYNGDFDKHAIERNPYTFKHMLNFCYQTKDVPLAWKIWEDYQDFLERRGDIHSTADEDSISLQKKHEIELLDKQIKEGWSFDHQRNLVVAMANTLARSSDDLTQALHFLAVQFHKDRPLAKHKPTLRSLLPMYNRAIFLDDLETKKTIQWLCADDKKNKWRSHLAYKYRRVNDHSPQ